MFPVIFTLAIDSLGQHTNQGSGILCLAIVPLLMGVLADNFGLQNSFIITVLCYAYIFYYAVKGFKHN
jgi:FHS family L-fucose permease-like MFS transporter